MKKTKLKLGICAISSLFIVSYLPIMADSVSPGDTFNVNIACGDVEGSVQAQASNASISSAGNWCERGKSVPVTAVAGSAGTATISIIGVDATGNVSTANPVDFSGTTIGSVSVTVLSPTPSGGDSNSGGSSSGGNTTNEQPKQETPKEEPKETKSSDSSLVSLGVSEGKLSPEFKAGTTSYKLNLPEGTKSINVSAKAKDGKASVSGTGKIEVKDGDNAINVTVTAEDGSSTVYTIKAYVQEKAVATLTMGDKKLNVFTNVKGAAIDNKAFEKTKIKINNTEVPAWKSEAQNITLLYLNGDDGNNFYIYDEKTQKVTSIYKPVGVLGQNLIIVNVPANLQTRSNMKFTTIEVDKVKFPGWIFDDESFKDFAIIYALDQNGKEVYYQYDSKEKTLQRFSNAAAISQEKYDAYVKEKENKEQTLMYVIYGLGAGCVVCLGLAGYFFFHGRKPKVKYKKVDIEKEDYENRFHIEKEDE